MIASTLAVVIAHRVEETKQEPTKQTESFEEAPKSRAKKQLTLMEFAGDAVFKSNLYKRDGRLKRSFIKKNKLSSERKKTGSVGSQASR